jgi:hypothetical protein
MKSRHVFVPFGRLSFTLVLLAATPPVLASAPHEKVHAPKAQAPKAQALEAQAPEAPRFVFRSSSACPVPLTFSIDEEFKPTFVVGTGVGDIQVSLELAEFIPCRSARYVSSRPDRIPTVEVEIRDLCMGRLPSGTASVAFSGVAFACDLNLDAR